MNCQEFKHAWMHDTDNAALSHIESCEECMAWIEANFTSDEEVQFLKEYPQPSAQLEDRIMQAIYQTAGQGVVPPLTATLQDASAVQPSPRRWPRYSGLAWASAAGFLLAVGLLGYQTMMTTDKQVAMESTAANQAATHESPVLEQQAPAVSPEPQAGSALATTQTAPEPAAETAAGAQPTTKSDAKATPPSAEQPAALSAQPKAETPQERPMIAARNNQSKASTAEAQQPSNEKVVMADAVARSGEPAALQPGSPNQGITSAKESANSITAMPDQSNAELADGKAATVGPPNIAAAKPAITLSSFSDVETAVQASDMPVPSAGKLPSGFALNSINLQYESETSKHVTRTAVDYNRGADVIKVEVVRNAHGKRSLSIPGTFTDTQLFTIDSEQAIAVSYDPQAAPPDSAVQHAVHFNTQKENQSLYVILTASGVRLDELIEVAKQLNWK